MQRSVNDLRTGPLIDAEREIPMKSWRFSVILFLFVGVGVMAQTAPAQDSAGQVKPPVHAFNKATTIIYVSDFELDAQNMKTD
jgi:hypothetical protein